MEGPRPRYTPPFADAERAVCLLRPPKCPLRSHEHERATIARYARARGHHPPIHRTGSGALKTMERGPGPFCRERRAVRDLPVFFFLMGNHTGRSFHSWRGKMHVLKRDRKGETDREEMESRYGSWTGNGACFHDGFSRTGLYARLV